VVLEEEPQGCPDRVLGLQVESLLDEAVQSVQVDRGQGQADAGSNGFYGQHGDPSIDFFIPLRVSLAVFRFKYFPGFLKKAMAKFTMSVPAAMQEALERERQRRRLGTIQETIRNILAEYFKEQV